MDWSKSLSPGPCDEDGVSCRMRCTVEKEVQAKLRTYFVSDALRKDGDANALKLQAKWPS
jgi:hypothetical protein